MSLGIISSNIFILFSIIFVDHTEGLLPIQSDANAYLTCLQSSRKQITCDFSSLLENFTNVVRQMFSEEEANKWNLEYALKNYLQEINLEGIEEDCLRATSQLMSHCFRKHRHRDPAFEDALSSFINALRKKVASTRSNSVQPDDQKGTNAFSGRYRRTKATSSDQMDRRKDKQMKAPLSNRSVKALATTSNRKSIDRGQRYDEKKNFIHASKPTSSIYSLFAYSFFKNIATSRPLQRLFESIMLTNFARKNFYNAFYRASKKFGLPNPETVASTVALAIRETFDSLSSCSFISIIASSVGQYLYNLGVLNRDNYLNLAAQLANELNTSLINIPIGSKDIFLIQSLATGIVAYLYSLGLFTSRNAPLFAKYFANELLFSKENASVCRYGAIPLIPARVESRESFEEQPFLNKDINRAGKKRFSSILLEHLKTSDKFSKFVELLLNAEEASELSHKYIYQLATFLDLPYPDDVAEKIAGPIRSSLKNAHWYSFASVVVISLEKFLSAHSFLTPFNAGRLAKTYLKELNQVVLSSPSSSYIDIFFKATYRFVINKLLLDTENSNSLGSLFINELKSTEISESPVDSPAHERNVSIPMFLWNNYPEIYSPAGLSSKKAFIRVRNITENLAKSLLTTTGVNVKFFTKLFLSTVSEVYSNNLDIKTEGALLETLLEAISALLGIIRISSIQSIPEISEMNLVLSKAFRSEIL